MQPELQAARRRRNRGRAPAALHSCKTIDFLPGSRDLGFSKLARKLRPRSVRDATGKREKFTRRRALPNTLVATLQIGVLLIFWPRSALPGFAASAVWPCGRAPRKLKARRFQPRRVPEAPGEREKFTGRHAFPNTLLATLQIDVLLSFWPTSALTGFAASPRGRMAV